MKEIMKVCQVQRLEGEVVVKNTQKRGSLYPEWGESSEVISRVGKGQRSYPEWGERSEVISRGVRGPGLPRLRESPEFLAVSSSAPHPR